jgi:hypothetical protein
MDGYTLAIVGIVIVLAAFVICGAAKVELPASWVIIEKPKAAEPSLWEMPAFRRDVGLFVLYTAQWAVYAACAVAVIAMGVRLGLAH